MLLVRGDEVDPGLGGVTELDLDNPEGLGDAEGGTEPRFDLGLMLCCFAVVASREFPGAGVLLLYATSEDLSGEPSETSCLSLLTVRFSDSIIDCPEVVLVSTPARKPSGNPEVLSGLSPTPTGGERKNPVVLTSCELPTFTGSASGFCCFALFRLVIQFGCCGTLNLGLGDSGLLIAFSSQLDFVGLHRLLGLAGGLVNVGCDPLSGDGLSEEERSLFSSKFTPACRSPLAGWVSFDSRLVPFDRGTSRCRLVL